MRAYVKPKLYCETFELSQHIATCGIDVKSTDTNICETYLDPDFWGENTRVFTEVDINCGITRDKLQSYCNTVGREEMGKLFNS